MAMNEPMAISAKIPTKIRETELIWCCLGTEVATVEVAVAEAEPPRLTVVRGVAESCTPP